MTSYLQTCINRRVKQRAEDKIIDINIKIKF